MVPFWGTLLCLGVPPPLKILVMANQMTPSGKKEKEKKLIVHPSLICGRMNK
jgi:hypothetical protein